jgi:cyclic pyranopterin phosphate synthase
LEEVSTLIRAFASLGTKKIRLTGGEPALRKDLTQVIRVAKQTNGIDKVALTTNGYNLTKKVDQWVAAGLDSINISLDSFNPKQFQLITGVDRLTPILEGIDKALNHPDLSVKINTVLLKTYNGSELKNILDYVRQKRVTLRFIELMRTNDNLSFFKANHIAGSTLLDQLLNAGWHRKLKSPLDGPAIELIHPEYQGSIGFVMPYSKNFCKDCNRLRVSANGNLHLCLFSDEGSSLRQALSSSEEDLKRRITSLVGYKQPMHYLEHGNSGSTRHLAMIGG